jgi:hypothetical protein
MRDIIECKGCGKDTGSASPRCEACERKRREKWKEWRDAGKCPRCPEHRDLMPGCDSCFECGFGVSSDEEGDDYVGAIFGEPPKHKRLADRWKSGPKD